MKKNSFKLTGSRLTVGFLAVIAALTIAAGSFTSVFALESGTLRTFQIGDKLLPITLPTINDSVPLSFSPGKGKPSVILFFSIRPDFRKKRSLALLSTLNDLADKYKTQLDVIGVYSDDKGKDTLKTFINKSSISLRVFNDDQKKAYTKYGVFMMPLVVLSDSTGNLHEVIPYTYNIREIVEANIRLLLGEWDRKQFKDALMPKEKIMKSTEEKEYIRRVNYGRIMLTKKMYGQAIREFSNAVKLMPQFIDAHVELGFALLESKKYDKAETSFKKALEIDSQSDDAIAGLGLTYYDRGEFETAIVELEKAFITPKPRLEVIIALAEIYEQQGLNQKANRLNKLAVSKLMTMYEQRWQ